MLRFFDFEDKRETLSYVESETNDPVPADRATGRVRRARENSKWIIEKMLKMVNTQIWRGFEAFSRGTGKGFTIGVNLTANLNAMKFGFWRSLGVGVNYFKDKSTGKKRLEILYQVETKVPGTKALSLEVSIAPYVMRYISNPETFSREGTITGRTVVTPASGLTRVDRGSFAVGMNTLTFNMLSAGTLGLAGYLASHGMAYEASLLTPVWFVMSAVNFSNFASLDSRRTLVKSWLFGSKNAFACARLIL